MTPVEKLRSDHEAMETLRRASLGRGWAWRYDGMDLTQVPKEHTVTTYKDPAEAVGGGVQRDEQPAVISELTPWQAIGYSLRDARVRVGIGLRALAFRVGITPTQLGLIERGVEASMQPTYQCQGCGYYTDKDKRWIETHACPECGKEHYWSGSFVDPATPAGGVRQVNETKPGSGTGSKHRPVGFGQEKGGTGG